MYVERQILERFRKLSGVYGALAIIGPRQAGKTTFLKERAKERKAKYISFDDPDVRESFNTDVKKFRIQYIGGYKTAIFDEPQYGKDVGQKIKYLVDSGQKLWLTASSSILLSKDVLSYLVGRISVIELFPFSLEEFLRARGLARPTGTVMRRAVWEHALYGGYPKIVLTEDVEIKTTMLKDLRETMILKDIVREFSVEDLDSLQRFVRFLAINAGGSINYSSISNVVGVSFKTIKKYLNALEATYIIKRVVPFYTNKNKELSKNPKVYFIDTGMRNAIIGEFRDIDGQIFENYVFSELLKMGFEPKYWRTKSGAEIDFVVNGIPVEVKLRFSKLEKSNLRSFIREYRPEKAVIVTYSGEERVIEEKGCKIFVTGVAGMKSLLTSAG